MKLVPNLSKSPETTRSTDYVHSPFSVVTVIAVTPSIVRSHNETVLFTVSSVRRMGPTAHTATFAQVFCAKNAGYVTPPHKKGKQGPGGIPHEKTR